MTYTTSAAFAKRLTTIKKGVVSVRADIQAALIDATYLCLANSGGTTPFQQVFDVVGNAVHRQGISVWAETFAPVRMVKDKLLLNKSAWDLLDRESALADFEKFIAETGMNAPENLWYMIAKESNTTQSVFDLDKTLDSFIKKLEKNDLSGLGAAMRKAEQDYFASALKAELAAQGKRKPAKVAKDVV